MKTIRGFTIEMDFGQFIKLSDLIYYDGPILSHYISPNGENYMFYWVDANETYNRWLVIRTTCELLDSYIYGKKTLYELITNPIDKFLYYVDVDNNINYHNTTVISVQQILEEYLPSVDSFYEFEPIDAVDSYQISKKYKQGVFELYLKGKDVGYGRISLEKLAPILPKFEDIRKSMSSKYISNLTKQRTKDKDRNKDRDKKKNIIEFARLSTSFQLVDTLAGSMRLIFVSEDNQSQISETYSDAFAQEIISLFESGNNKEDIGRISKKYDKDLIKKYSDFMSCIDKERLNFGVKWNNAAIEKSIEKKFNQEEIGEIISNLADFEYDEVKDIRTSGIFYSINTKSGSYSFESDELSEEEIKSTGTFDKPRRDLIQFITFHDRYNVTIERRIATKVGDKPKTIDKIVSYYKCNDMITNDK